MPGYANSCSSPPEPELVQAASAPLQLLLHSPCADLSWLQLADKLGVQAVAESCC